MYSIWKNRKNIVIWWGTSLLHECGGYCARVRFPIRICACVRACHMGPRSTGQVCVFNVVVYCLSQFIHAKNIHAGPQTKPRNSGDHCWKIILSGRIPNPLLSPKWYPHVWWEMCCLWHICSRSYPPRPPVFICTFRLLRYPTAVMEVVKH